MSETYEEVDAELRRATKEATRVNSEDESRFASTTPRRNGDTSISLSEDAVESMNEVLATEEIQHEAERKMKKIRDGQKGN